MYQSPVCYKHKGKSGDFTFRSTKGDEEKEEETGWWEEGDSPEADTSPEDDEGWSGWWWRLPLFLIIVFSWEYVKCCI